MPNAANPDTAPAPASVPGPAPAPSLTGGRALGVFACVTAVLAVVDLASKHVAFERIGPTEVIQVIPGLFNLIQARNIGAAFSIMSGQMVFFIAISLGALALLSYFSWSAKSSGAGYQVVLGLVASGVVGNLYDRVCYGYVRDFLDVYVSSPRAARWLVEHFHTNHWPTFNVADMAICVGTACLFVKFWRDEKAARAAAAPAL